MRELRTEIGGETRAALREQLADEELLPTQREALEQRESEIKNRQTDVRLTIQEMCAQRPMLLRDEFAPFQSTEGQRIGDTPTEELMKTTSDSIDLGANVIGGLGHGIVNALGGGVSFLADSFGGGHSKLTPEVAAARREKAEASAEAAEAAPKIRREEDDLERRIQELVRLMKEAEDQQRRREKEYELERGR